MADTIEEWDLSQTNQRRIRQRKYEVAVLPIGATEAHNLHLPEGQDSLQVDCIAKRACREAWKASPNIICLPTMPYGSDCNLMDFPLTVDVRQSTLDLFVRDVAASMAHHGIRKFVIINGHGGNDFMALLRQLQCDLNISIFLCNWWLVGQDRYDELFSKPDDHAGQMETSVALATHPELVELEHAKNGQARPFLFEALSKGWVRTSRIFSKLNDHCAVGDPSGATNDKGVRYIEIVCSRISQFLVELAKATVNEVFPHKP